MKNVIWVLCVALVLACLAGCQTEQMVPSSIASTLPADGTDADAPSENTTSPGSAEPVDIRPLPPENPGSSLVDYDPDRQIYIDAKGIYLDYYSGVTFGGKISFYILSRTWLDPADIQVTVPLDLPVDVSVRYVEELKRETAAMLDEEFLDQSGGDLTMPYYVYQAYRGVDFSTLLEAKQDDSEEKDPRLVAALEAEAQMRLNFAQLQPSDLPEFYVYSVGIPLINLPEITEPLTLEKVDVTIGKEVYEVKLGEVRLLPREMFPAEAPVKGLRAQSSRYYELYNDGVVTITDAYRAEDIKEDMTLTGLYFAESEVQVQEIRVHIQSVQGALEMVWDGKSPIYLYQGDSIYIETVIQDDRTNEFISRVTWHAVVEYLDGQNEEKCAVTLHTKNMGWNLYELYAIIFDGVDMESYYRDYLYPSLVYE